MGPKSIAFNFFLVDTCLKLRFSSTHLLKTLPIYVGIYHPEVDKNSVVHPEIIKSVYLIDSFSRRRSGIDLLGSGYRTVNLWTSSVVELSESLYGFLSDLGIFNKRLRVELGYSSFRSLYTFEFSFRNLIPLFRRISTDELELFMSNSDSLALIFRIKFSHFSPRIRYSNMLVSIYGFN